MGHNQRAYLELTADRIEATLAAHGAPVHITGGTVGPRLIRFNVQPAPHVRLSQIRALSEDVAAAMQIPNIRTVRGEEGIVFEFANPQTRTLTLLDELAALNFDPWPEGIAYLGIADSGGPLLARLSSPEVAHILIAGTTGSGKSVLLRGVSASLVLGHDPAALRLVCVDPKGRAFDAVAHAPHLTQPPIRDAREAARLLGGLARLMEERDRQRTDSPRIVVLIDELADLVMADGKGVETSLTRLLQRGREAGIHVVAATQRPSAAILNGLMRANFPLRLVGRVVTPEDARIASGRGGTGAELLYGRGDFLTVGANVTRFQAALVNDDKVRQAIARQWPGRGAELVLPPVDDTLITEIDPAQADAERLAALDKEHGPFRSNRQRELALCGYAGGQASVRVQRALAWAGTTTTTPATPVLAFAGR